MKKSFFLFCGLLFMVFTLSSNTTKDGSPLIGSWVFNVNQAPWEYSRGKVIFEEDKEENVSGKILFSSGREIDISRIYQDDKDIVFHLYVDGYSVKTIVTLKDDKLNGVVETFDGNMVFTANRELPE